MRNVLGGALKKARLESVRAPARQVERELQPPHTRDTRIRALLRRLAEVEGSMPRTLSTVVELRRAIRAIDEEYFMSYMEWRKRKPILERALDNPKAVYRD